MAVEIVPVVGDGDGVLSGAVAAEVESTGALAFTAQQQQQQQHGNVHFHAMPTVQVLMS